ncbi:MAG: ABC transporter ATP-binding protein, partial [SAR324 cluster bacterium]|nr:ABC transporter ATP-binding protein [SAR324 cluster bacterium]
MSLVEVVDLSKTYQMGETTISALKNVSLEIEEGTFISVVGPSGSGKTTLLNLMGVLDKPSSGSVKVAGQEVSQLNNKQRANFRGDNLGFVFQNFNLIPVLTVYENVEYPLLMVKNESAGKKRDHVEALLDAVGVLEHQSKRPDQISGGQMQRVAVARALVPSPKLVIADEPTANLD